MKNVDVYYENPYDDVDALTFKDIPPHTFFTAKLVGVEDYLYFKYHMGIDDVTVLMGFPFNSTAPIKHWKIFPPDHGPSFSNIVLRKVDLVIKKKMPL